MDETMDQIHFGNWLAAQIFVGVVFGRFSTVILCFPTGYATNFGLYFNAQMRAASPSGGGAMVSFIIDH